MKKNILIITAIFSFVMLFTACKDTKKEEVKKENHEGHDHESEDMASKTYQCPMDCENGKTYDAEGSCPVCKMDLKEKSANMEHADGCKCIEDGDCKCADGECSCKENVACTKCEPGECDCKDEVATTGNCSSNCKPGKCGNKA